MMNNAYRAFWTFGKMWGLKPKVVYWIYTMVITPILTYGSTVWWPRVAYNVSRMELVKLQRLICLANHSPHNVPVSAPASPKKCKH
jgi:hypothetical protein